MSKINYNFLEKELLDSMLLNLKNEDTNKEIICEQVSTLTIFSIINAEQLRQLSYFKHYNDYRCYATHMYSNRSTDNNSSIINIRSRALADELVALKKKKISLLELHSTEADFKASAPVGRDRSDDESIIFQ